MGRLNEITVQEELVHRWDLPAVPDSVPRTRHEAQGLLNGWRIPAEVSDTCGSLLTEIVGNAVKHGGRRFLGKVCRRADTISVVLRYAKGELVIEVSDSNHCPPILDTAAADKESGRGLQIVEGLSAEWGYQKHPGFRKTVYAVVVT